jgi:predicted nucleic acid-binding protein
VLLLDTSVLIELDAVVLPEERYAVSAISYAELLFGVEHASDDGVRRKRRERLAWIERLGLAWEPFGIEAALGYARVAARVAQRRPAHARSKDVLLAGQAESMGAGIATLNPKDFGLLDDVVPIVVPPRRTG